MYPAKSPCFIYGGPNGRAVHDSEPDTITVETWPEKLAKMLQEMDIDAEANETGTEDLERGDYYSRYFSQTPRMVTNRGTLTLSGANIDMIQVVQKG